VLGQAVGNRLGLLHFHESNLRDKIAMGRITEASMSYIDFLEISARLTGFDVIELEATGMAETYLNVIKHETSADILQLFFTEARNILSAGSGDEEKTKALIASRLFPVSNYGGLAQNLVYMWYSGQWQPAVNAPDANLAQVRNISQNAYVEGLMWVAAETHPPGAKQPGFGSWAQIPICSTTK
jgi:hypothetical protein